MKTLTQSLQEINKIKNHSSSLDGINKIYLLEVHEKPNMIKIGDTHRDIALRNDETCTNASLHRSNKVTGWVAKKYDGSTFRDKELHKFLEDKGFKRELNKQGNKSEWFINISEETFVTLFEEFIGKPAYKVYELRPGQEYLKTDVINAFKSGTNFVNMDACVRVGKSILSLDIAKELNMFPCYIGKNLTSQTSVLKENNTFGIVDNMTVESIHGIEIEDNNGLTKKVNKIIESITTRNTNNQPILFFVDEVDDSSHTKKSVATMKTVVDYFTNIGLFGGFITMTGTRAHRGVKVLNALSNGAKVAETGIAYYQMQELQPEVTVKRNCTNITIYTETSELSNISTAMKSAVGRKSIANTLSTILSEGNSFGIEYNEKFPNVFLKFATVGKNNAGSIVKLLNSLHSNIDGIDYAYFNINGNVTTSSKAEKFCKKIITKNPNKRIVFVTQGMATTSFSVSSLGTSILFTDNEITADDIQSLHRSCTFTDGKLDANQVIVSTNNSNELAFSDIFEDEVITTNIEEKVKTYKRILENNCITHILVDGNEKEIYNITNENVKTYIDKKSEHQTTISSQIQSILDEELNFLEYIDIKIGSTSRKSKSAKASQSTNQLGEPKEKESKVKSTEMSMSKKEKILRTLFQNVSVMLAYSGNKHISKDNFDWNFFRVDEDAYDECYAFTTLKDRWDTIYNLCSDDTYYDENYFDKVAMLES